MTTYSAAPTGGIHKTLSGSADRVDVPDGVLPTVVEIHNRSQAGEELWVRADSDIAAAEDDGTTFVPAGTVLWIPVKDGNFVSIVGAIGAKWSLEVIPQDAPGRR